MAENNPAELTDCDSVAHTRVAQKENRSVGRIEILRSTAERNRPGGSVKYIAAAERCERCGHRARESGNAMPRIARSINAPDSLGGNCAGVPPESM